MLLTLIMDGFVAVLLLITIVYVFRLNSRLALLRQDRDHLGETVKALANASHQAESAVLGLKLTASDAGQELQASIDRAHAMKADLTFLIEKAGGTADRIEHVLKAQREPAARANTTKSSTQSDSVAVAKEDAKLGTGGRLARLLRQVDVTENPRRAEPPLKKNPTSVSADKQTDATPLKSRAERDLQRALEARR